LFLIEIPIAVASHLS